MANQAVNHAVSNRVRADVHKNLGRYAEDSLDARIRQVHHGVKQTGRTAHFNDSVATIQESQANLDARLDNLYDSK